MPDYFPAFLDLRGRRCLVVGGGPVGERKVRDLLACGAAVTLVSPTLTEGLAALVVEGRLDHRGRPFRRNDVQGCALVIAATGVTATDAQVAEEARRRRALVNAVDRPQQCDFIVPSVLRRGALQIAVSTGGRSPALAREIRKGLEPLFAPDYGVFVEQVGQQRRRVRTRAASSPARLAAGERALRRALAARPASRSRRPFGPWPTPSPRVPPTLSASASGNRPTHGTRSAAVLSVLNAKARSSGATACAGNDFELFPEISKIDKECRNAKPTPGLIRPIAPRKASRAFRR